VAASRSALPLFFSAATALRPRLTDPNRGGQQTLGSAFRASRTVDQPSVSIFKAGAGRRIYEEGEEASRSVGWNHASPAGASTLSVGPGLDPASGLPHGLRPTQGSALRGSGQGDISGD
jgi:hypothetical protein